MKPEQDALYEFLEFILMIKQADLLLKEMK